jgi:hypothetical protein
VPPAIPVAVATTTTCTAAPAAAALPSPAAAPPAALFGAITSFAVNRTVSSRFKGHRRRLSATGADHGRARAGARTGTVSPTPTLGMGRSVATPATPRTLLGLAAWFAAPRRGVTAFLEELLFPSGENKFLPTVATS